MNSQCINQRYEFIFMQQQRNISHSKARKTNEKYHRFIVHCFVVINYVVYVERSITKYTAWSVLLSFLLIQRSIGARTARTALISFLRIQSNGESSLGVCSLNGLDHSSRSNLACTSISALISHVLRSAQISLVLGFQLKIRWQCGGNNNVWCYEFAFSYHHENSDAPD